MKQNRIKNLFLAMTFLTLLFNSPVAAQAISVTNLPFPRVSVWWPNNDTQSVKDRARYDWVVLQNSDADHVTELRLLNPDIIVLGSNNARELNWTYDSYNHPLNQELRSASTDWIVTQAGTIVAGDVNVSSSTIQVLDSSRVVVGLPALLDNELMKVTAVNGNMITVERGKITPPATHKNGARIASTCSTWPNAIEFDVTADCPKVDVGYGLENWNDWNTRRVKNIISEGIWDGVVVDCYDANPSWWIGNGYAKSIDLNRDNIPDDLNIVNNSWNKGMIDYGTQLRTALGNDKIILPNCGVTNYVLNGKNYEDFPTANTSLSTWKSVVFGPMSFPNSSYLDWIKNGYGPNLSTIQAYNYDDFSQAKENWDYSGFAPAGFVPNYQKMRYGLTTALMGDGFYSFELTTSGHGVRALFWFDEYDNVGRERGYLGAPSGTAVPVGNTNVYRRDYSGGIVLCNPDTVAHTINLSGSYQKINGSQDHSVNDGSVVNSVTLQPRDGIILLRIPAVEKVFMPIPTMPSIFYRGNTITVTSSWLNPTTLMEMQAKLRKNKIPLKQKR